MNALPNSAMTRTLRLCKLGMRCTSDADFGKGDFEDGTGGAAILARDVRGAQRAALSRDERAGERESHAKALALLRSGTPVEAFEEAVQMFRRYPYPCICKAEIIVILVFTETVDVYLNIGSGVCDGIVHQVTEDGIEQ